MLYSEFLTGTNTTENAWTYKEYKRIEAIYNNDNSMDKQQACNLYQQPDELTATLMKELSTARHEATEEACKVIKLTRELEEANEALRSETSKRISLQATLDDVTIMIHKAYYRITD